MIPEKQKAVRVRIAPSPKGALHVGTARTALFNWLFAKANEGIIVLRIEDTDKERSTKEFETDIIKGLQWLGIDWDEGPDKEGEYGPYRQSERGAHYTKYLTQLLEKRSAYHCFCTEDELENARQIQLTEGHAPKYSGRCRALSNDTVVANIAAGKNSIIRFKTPDKHITFHDLVRGDVEFDMALIGDFVIAKSVDEPLYNFAVVVDDNEMKISHVIRGEDHIANTPKQIAIQDALEMRHPKYAHVSLLLDPERKKLSKRYAAVGVEEYRKEGYLADAMTNFLALLGWHPQDDQELLTREEIVKAFDIERVQKGGAIFNTEKLDWMNGQYLKQYTNEEILEQVRGVTNIPKGFSEKELLKIVGIVKERMKTLMNFTTMTQFFWEVPNYIGDLLIWKDAPKESVRENLEETIKILSSLSEEDFTREGTESAVNEFATEKGKGAILWPLRAALSGSEYSPGPYEIMDVLGKKRTLERLENAVTLLQ